MKELIVTVRIQVESLGKIKDVQIQNILIFQFTRNSLEFMGSENSANIFLRKLELFST